MQCPRCESSTFIEKDYEQTQIDVCQNCQGTWLDEKEILDIVSIADKTFSEEFIQKTISQSFSGVPKHEQDKELLCPKCSTTMSAINYEVSSGVIIDRCPNGHGLWFDKDELEKVQAYREYWQANVKKSLDSFTEILERGENDKAYRLKQQEKEQTLLYTLSNIFSKLIN